MKLKNLAIAAVAAACIAPTAASAKAVTPGGVAVAVGKKIIDKAFGAAVSQVIVEAFGLGAQGPVDLSDAALTQIADLMNDAVSAGWRNEYINMVQAAVEGARAYHRPVDLQNAIVQVDVVIRDARNAAARLDNADGEPVAIRELPAYIVMRSLEIRFLEERAVIYGLLGDAGSQAASRSNRAQVAADTLGQIRRVQNLWDGLRQVDLRPTWDKKIGDTQHWGCNDSDNLTSCATETFARCYTGTDGNDAPIEVCSQTTYTCTSEQWTFFDMGRSCNSTADADSELNTYRPAQQQADFERIFGDLGLLKVRLAEIAGLQGNCPIGQFDGDDCFLLTAPEGAEPFIYDNGLYTSRRPTPTCPEGDFDGRNCVIGRAPAGTTAFAAGDSLYTTPRQGQCTVGGFDGRNCHVGPMPAGTSRFELNGHLYTTPQAGGVCALGGFDGRNCYIGPMPIGSHTFIYAGQLYTTPGGVCAMGTSDGANCFVAQAPAGASAFTINDMLFTTPSQALTCDGIGSFDGANCFVAHPEAGSAPFIYQRSLYLTTN